MAAEWIPAAGLAVGAAATMVAARLNSRPNDRGVAVTEMQAGLSEQRIMLDRAYERIGALEDEVAECERGRAADREAFALQISELRVEMRERTRGDQ